MLDLLRKLFLFRVGQKTTKGFAHKIGLRTLAPIVGLIGGLRFMRRHS